MKNLYWRILLLCLLPYSQLDGQCPHNSLNYGTNDYVLTSDAPALRTVNFTMEGWFNFDNAIGLQLLIDKHLGTGALDSYEMWIQNGRFFGIIADNSGFGPAISAPFVPVLGTWYHLAYSFDDPTNSQSLFINGIQVATGVVTKTIAYDNEPLLLGASNDNQNPQYFFHGSMDEVRLWDHARSTTEIAMTMTCCLSGNTPGLIARYAFDEGIAGSNNAGVTNLPDLAGNNDGTLNNFTLNGGTSNWVFSQAFTPTNCSLPSAVPTISQWGLVLLCLLLLCVGAIAIRQRLTGVGVSD